MIDLKNILAHLPDNKIKELETITQRIVDTGKAEIVVLFGSYARGNYKEQRGKTQGKKSDYDILAVSFDYETKKELRSELRGAFKDISVPVQLIVETIDFVNSNLEEKQFFFTDIKREGKVLYNSRNFKLSDSKELTPKRRREIAEKDSNQWFGEAKKSFKGFEFYLSETFFGKASFELQQVVEMCYTAIEMVFTHYNPHEHNLKTLRERIISFDRRIKYVLPYETAEQQELFDYLNFAYIGGRYRSEEDFPVTTVQLDYWSGEAEKLIELTKIICQERIACLKGIEKDDNTI
ncbi:MAG: HEPN domain-containing protein [Bacteroidales bacterium]|nr:HEPN domain-containing protein [Bacteroidales bacterium]